MPFPVPPPVLDTFTRADGAIGGLWKNLVDGGTAATFTIVSNAAVAQANGWVYYDAGFGPVCEAKAKVAAYSSGICELEMLVNAGGANWGGYAITTSGVNTSILRYGPNGTADSTLDTAVGTFAPGDEMGIRIKPGGVVEAWGKPAAGSWTLLKSATDASPITGDFKPSLFGSVAGTSFDDFGALNLSSGSSLSLFSRRRRKRE